MYSNMIKLENFYLYATNHCYVIKLVLKTYDNKTFYYRKCIDIVYTITCL